MADLDNATKRKLETIFDMSGGYVLDFSNARFADFVRTSIGIDPYEKYAPGSKAVLLRTIWHEEPVPVVAKLNLELLEYWRVGKLVNDQEPTPSESALHDELRAQFAGLTELSAAPSTDFLAKDFSEIDLTALPRELTSQQVVQAGLAEIEWCLAAKAPLAVIFLVGSTLEGLLIELAMAHPSTYVSSKAAPSVGGTTKPLDTWTLAELIAVSRALGVVGEDVLRHAEHVKNFRNYIHPRQQLRENFEPRPVTAEIVQHVLHAAVADLQNASAVGRIGRG